MSEIKHQLLLCRFLYSKGSGLLASGGYYDAGLAVSTLQDAVELALFAAAAQLGASPKRNAGFSDIWNACDESYRAKHGAPLPLKLEMDCLNNVRIAFKHYGNLSNAGTSAEHRRTAGQFLSAIFTEVFSQEFTTYSLVSIVENQHERDALQTAINAVEDGDQKGALQRCADALDLIRQRREQLYVQSILVSYPNIDAEIRRHIADEVTHLRSQILGLADIVLAGQCGIGASDYAIVTSMVPRRVGGAYENEKDWASRIGDDPVRRCIDLIAQYSIGLSERLSAPQRILGEYSWLF